MMTKVGYEIFFFARELSPHQVAFYFSDLIFESITISHISVVTQGFMVP